MHRPVRYLACAGALLFTAVPAHSSGRSPGYLPPDPVEGNVFPVARTDHYSVINFADDWHDPRMRLIDGSWQLVGLHEGTDVFAEPGTPVRAIAPGLIENIGWLFYSGWRIGVRGDDGRYWFYAHMSEFAPEMGEGTRVEAGTIIGRVGNTGYGNKPGHSNEFTWHLHVGIQEADGTWINPHPMLKSLYGVEGR